MSDNYNLVSKQNNGLWANKHKSKENHPDWKGVLNVTDEQLKKLIERRKEGDVNEHGNVEIQLAAYENTARESGNKWFALYGEVTNSKRQDAQAKSTDDIPF